MVNPSLVVPTDAPFCQIEVARHRRQIDQTPVGRRCATSATRAFWPVEPKRAGDRAELAAGELQQGVVLEMDEAGRNAGRPHAGSTPW